MGVSERDETGCGSGEGRGISGRSEGEGGEGEGEGEGGRGEEELAARGLGGVSSEPFMVVRGDSGVGGRGQTYNMAAGDEESFYASQKSASLCQRW